VRQRGVEMTVGGGDGPKAMTRAGVGGEKRGVGGKKTGEEAGGEGEGKEEEEDEGKGRGQMAERSASREEGRGVGGTRVRPSSPMRWSLCLFQHG
jgi:hypothetical protein